MGHVHAYLQQFSSKLADTSKNRAF